MYKPLFGLAIAVGFATSCLFAVGVATADPYKWCAVYGGEDGGGTNCGFVTIEQCRATISGMGGFCEPNQFYTGPDKRPAKRARKHGQG
jgi:Protein of unknown function (DUF3551)